MEYGDVRLSPENIRSGIRRMVINHQEGDGPQGTVMAQEIRENVGFIVG